MNRLRDDGGRARYGTLEKHSNQLLALIPEGDIDQLAETLVAFANADGGIIYVGVAEGGRPTGAVYPEEIEPVVQQAELKCRPPIRVEWEQWETGGAFVFVGRVQRSPVIHVLDDGRVLVRTGDLNRPLSDAQLQKMTTSRSVGDYEVEPATGMNRADLDDEVLREFVQIWEERQGRQLTRPIDDFLIEMGWLRSDGQPTVAGILLFGKSPSAFLPRCGVTFIRFEGTQLRGPDGGASYGRRVEINAPLAHTIKRTWDILKEEIHVGAVVRGLKREEQWVYPHRNSRGARQRGRPSRLPPPRTGYRGPSLLRPARDQQPRWPSRLHHPRQHRRRTLLPQPTHRQRPLQWGYIEELGLGVDLMIDEMLRAGHPMPAFKADDAMFTVTFQSAQQRGPLPFSASGQSMNERQAKALAYVHQNQRIRSRDYQELCPDVSPETLRLDLADLVERGLLLKIGKSAGPTTS